MNDNKQQPGFWTRRDVLKAGFYGACAVCVGKGIFLPDSAHAGHPRKGFINPRPSPWFSRLTDLNIQCTLCPTQCRLKPGERGVCRVRENRGGKGYTLAYGNPVIVQLDPVERKPFFHVTPGKRALSVSTAGCPLNCRFCEVWDMALVDPEEVHAYDLPPEKIVGHALSVGAKAISYAFGEPVVFYEYMSDTAVMAKQEGLLNLMHTSGYISQKPLKALVDKLDAVNVDFKGYDQEFYRRLVGGDLQPVKDAVRMLKQAGVHLEITNLVIPTANDGMDEVKKMCEWIIEELGPDVPIHFARFYPLYKLTNLPPTPVATLDRVRKTAMKAGLRYVYIARVTGHEGENTFCHECGKIIIERMGFMIEALRLESGRCSYCSAPVSGIWS